MDLDEIIENSLKFRVLYVEDNEGARVATLGFLSEFFGEIVEAVNGKDGYEKFQEGNFDLIIADISMPVLSGLEMSKLIREIDKDVPILLLSALSEPKNEGLNIYGYMHKPINMDKFLEIIERLVTES